MCNKDQSINSGELDQRDRTMNERNDSARAIKARLDEIKQKITNTGNTQLTPSIAELVRDSAYELTSKLKKHSYDDVARYVRCTVENRDGRLLNSCLSDVGYEPGVIRLGVADLPVGPKIYPKPVDKPTIGRIVHYVNRRCIPSVIPALIQCVNSDGTVNLVIFYETGEVNMQCGTFMRDVSQGDLSGQWKWPDRV